MPKYATAEEWWRSLLTGDSPEVPVRQVRYVLSLFPSHARCKFCNAPYDGILAPLMRLLGRGPAFTRAWHL
jgi:hypothetical protein